ncbi:hypothetical protein DFJ77DRAFT_451876 [Powellomyces hirtus]|nr:hypothetical protein DFJ77DRAFT_451876 [Powellomyces hirtus]
MTYPQDFAKFHEKCRQRLTATLVARLTQHPSLKRTEDAAKRHVDEYIRFLYLKATCRDWEARLLCPGPVVDVVWHQHILDTRRYLEDTNALCGHYVHHDPDDQRDVVARGRRYRACLALYEVHFDGPAPVDCWPREPVAVVANPSLSRRPFEPKVPSHVDFWPLESVASPPVQTPSSSRRPSESKVPTTQLILPPSTKSPPPPLPKVEGFVWMKKGKRNAVLISFDDFNAATVDDLRRRIEMFTMIPPINQRIEYMGMEMKEGRLVDCRVYCGAQVSLL